VRVEHSQAVHLFWQVALDLCPAMPTEPSVGCAFGDKQLSAERDDASAVCLPKGYTMFVDMAAVGIDFFNQEKEVARRKWLRPRAVGRGACSQHPISGLKGGEIGGCQLCCLL
jgi:hypothetical protein